MERSLINDKERADVNVLEGNDGKFKQLMIHVTFANASVWIW